MSAQETLNRLSERQLPFAEHILSRIEDGHQVASVDSTLYVVQGRYCATKVFLNRQQAWEYSLLSYDNKLEGVTLE